MRVRFEGVHQASRGEDLIVDEKKLVGQVESGIGEAVKRVVADLLDVAPFPSADIEIDIEDDRVVVSMVSRPDVHEELLAAAQEA